MWRSGNHIFKNLEKFLQLSTKIISELHNNQGKGWNMISKLSSSDFNHMNSSVEIQFPQLLTKKEISMCVIILKAFNIIDNINRCFTESTNPSAISYHDPQ